MVDSMKEKEVQEEKVNEEDSEIQDQLGEDFRKLIDIQGKMIELVEEAEYLVRITGDKNILDRAKAYWIPHIKMALLNDTEYVGKSMVTMEDTIAEIKKLKEKTIDEN